MYKTKNLYNSMLLIIIILTTVLTLVACSDNNKGSLDESNNDKESLQVESSEVIDKKITMETNSKSNDENSDLITLDEQNVKHIVKDNKRITRYYELSNTNVNNIDSISIEKDRFIIKSTNIDQNKIELINETCGDENIISVTKQISNDKSIFFAGYYNIGINSKEGIKVYSMYADDEINLYERLLSFDLTNAVGKKLINFDDLYFLGYEENNFTYLISFKPYDTNQYKMSLQGDILEIKKLVDGNFIIVTQSKNELIFNLINEKCELIKATKLDLDDKLEYKGITQNAYNSLHLYLNYKNKNESQIINIYINDMDVNTQYAVPYKFEQILDVDNTYIFIVDDQSGNKSLVVCDRNYTFLDEIDFGIDKLSTISNLKFHKTYDVPQAFITGVVEYNNKSYFIKIELNKMEDYKTLIIPSKSQRINIDKDNHIYYTSGINSNDGFAFINFNTKTSIDVISDSPYFILENRLYRNTNNLITKIKDIDFSYNGLKAFKIGDDCYCFYNHGEYLFTNSLQDNKNIEKFYDSVLINSLPPKSIYIDKSNNEALIKDEIHLYTLSYDNNKKIICNNINELGLNGEEIYKENSIILIYDENSIFSYDKMNNKLIKSHFSEPISWFKIYFSDNDIIIYSSNNVYKYSANTQKLTKVNIPDNDSSPYIREENGYLRVGNYYYDTVDGILKSYRLIEPKKFNGAIDNKYYYPTLNFEMENTSPNEITLYSTPFINYSIGNKKIKLIDYNTKEGITYILEYESNNLYKIKNNTLMKISNENIRNYDISKDYLAYTSNLINENLYLKNLINNKQDIIYSGSVLDIGICKENVYFLDLDDNNIYHYNVNNKASKQLTKTNDVKKIYYTDEYIIYQEPDKFYIMDKDNFEFIDSMEGNIMVIDDDKNRIYYDNFVLTLVYDLDSNINEVYSTTNLDCDGLLNDKLIGEVYYDGPGGIGVINKGDFDLYKEGNKDYKINEKYSISDIGVMYGLAYYIFENDTLKYHKLVDYNNYVEDEGKIYLYYDDDNIYYKWKESYSSEDYIWVQYNISTGNKQSVETIDKTNLNVVSGVPRGA